MKGLMSQQALQQWCKHIEQFRMPVLKQALQQVSLAGTGLEVGAGTCWLASTLSRKNDVEKIFVLDHDVARFELAKKYFIPRYDGRMPKINFLNSDFHKIPLANTSLDFVVCDAVLHHTESLPVLLSEIHRVLKPGGTLLAIREPVLPNFLPISWIKKKTFGRQQRRRGDVELIHPQKYWSQAFTQADFAFTMYEHYLDTSPKEKIVRFLGDRWNGVLFNRYFFIAKSK